MNTLSKEPQDNKVNTLLTTVLSFFKRKPKKRCHDVPLAQRDICMPNDIRICKKCSEYY